MSTGWETQAPNEDAFAVDGSQFSGEDLGGGGNVDKEGYYHFEIADVVNELDAVSEKGKAKAPAVRFDLLVLHSVPNQSPSGCRHFHRIYLGTNEGGPPAAGSQKSALRFGLGLGILREVEKDGKKSIVDAKTGSSRITLGTWHEAKGRQCIGKIVFKPAEGQYQASYELPFGRVCQVDDPSVAGVPKNRDALAMIGKASASVPVGNGALPPVSAQQQQPATSATAGGLDLSDL